MLLDLVDDLTPYFIVIPQFQLDTLDDEPLADNSIATTAQANAKELTPDFSIAVFDLVRRHISAALPTPPLFPADFNLWRDVRVNVMKIPLIAELKRPPTRHAKSKENFYQDLIAQLTSARHDLDIQAEHAFLMQPSLDQIVLVACCGEWWSWTISMRAAHVTQEFNLPQEVAGLQEEIDLEEVDGDVLELRTRESLPRPAKMHPKGKYRDTSPPPPSKSDKIPYTYKPGKRRPKGEPKEGTKTKGGEKTREKEKAETKAETETKETDPIFIRYTELKEGAMEYVKPNVEDALPPNNEWSLPILFGSEASAQHFFLIHRFLEAELLVPGTEDQASLYPYSLDLNLTLTCLTFEG